MEQWQSRQIAAGEFKARCLQLMDEVKRSGIELVITKHGRPVAKLVPVSDDGDTAFGWMRGSVRVLGDVVSPDTEAWSESA